MTTIVCNPGTKVVSEVWAPKDYVLVKGEGGWHVIKRNRCTWLTDDQMLDIYHKALEQYNIWNLQTKVEVGE